MTTHMKSLNFKLLLLLTLLFPFHINAQDSIPAPTLYDRHIERYTSLWENLIPRYSKIQFAGSMASDGTTTAITGKQTFSSGLFPKPPVT